MAVVGGLGHGRGSLLRLIIYPLGAIRVGATQPPSRPSPRNCRGLLHFQKPKMEEDACLRPGCVWRGRAVHPGWLMLPADDTLPGRNRPYTCGRGWRGEGWMPSTPTAERAARVGQVWTRNGYGSSTHRPADTKPAARCARRTSNLAPDPWHLALAPWHIQPET